MCTWNTIKKVALDVAWRDTSKRWTFVFVPSIFSPHTIHSLVCLIICTMYSFISLLFREIVDAFNFNAFLLRSIFITVIYVLTAINLRLIHMHGSCFTKPKPLFIYAFAPIFTQTHSMPHTNVSARCWKPYAFKMFYFNMRVVDSLLSLSLATKAFNSRDIVSIVECRLI